MTVFWKRIQENSTLIPLWFAMRIQSETSGTTVVTSNETAIVKGCRKSTTEVSVLSTLRIDALVIARPLCSTGGSMHASATDPLPPAADRLLR